MKREHFDVLIIGAGLSGIGMACHLKRKCPSKDFVILEGREAMGGTWDLFRYPGVRADSDMHTLSYSFKPWEQAEELADGTSILEYIQEAAAEHQIDKHIRYDHAVKKVSWSTEDAAWTVEATRGAGDESVRLTCNMLVMCVGYYSYESGYMPEIEGCDEFQGQIVHPQKWPSDLDYAGKRVIVVGSGATAVSMVPVLAEQAEHVMMLQRSPTYMMSRPETSIVWRALRSVLPIKIASAMGGWFNRTVGAFFYRRARTRPDRVRDFLLKGVRKELGSDYDVEKHFAPTYNPWDQRLCLVRDGDLFASIRSGKVSMITAHIDRFTHSGLRLKSGQELEADIVITATGLKLEVWGGIDVEVDGQKIEPAETFTYKGLMNSDVPNLVAVFGYVNASWTLRADLISEFVCRLVNYMDEHQWQRCTPRVREADLDMETGPFIEHFTPNYIQRAIHLMPKQGDREPWLNTQDYKVEKKRFAAPFDDGSLVFE